MKSQIPYVIGKREYEYGEFIPPLGFARSFAPEKENLFFKACEELEKRAVDKAEITLTSIVHKYPDFLESRFLLSALKINKGDWQQAQFALMPLSSKKYFIGYWIFRFMPDFRLVMQADPTYWLTILPRSEEALIALALIRKHQGDSNSCFSITKRAFQQFPNNMSLRVFYASQLIERDYNEDALKLLNTRVTKRYDDLAVIYRYLRGLALVKCDDHRSGFYQMESALDFSAEASPYLKENIRFRIIEEYIRNRYFIDAINQLDNLQSSVATNIPDSFDPIDVRNELALKVNTYIERGIDVRMSLQGFKKPSEDEDDFWEVGENG